GPGLMNLYWAVTQLEAQPRTAKSPAEITAAARRGEPLAMKTVEMFSTMLGTVAGDLALTVGARGGIYIGGGIVPRLLPAFAHSGFRGSFESKGRYDRYMAAIPTYVITAALPAFRGLRRLLGYR